MRLTTFQKALWAAAGLACLAYGTWVLVADPATPPRAEAAFRPVFSLPDAEGRIRSASPAALALLGLELEDALGHSFEALLDPASPRPVPDGAVHALTLGGVPRREVHYAAQRLQDGLQVAVLAGA